MTVIAVNAMILESGRPSGVGQYVIQLLTQFGRAAGAQPSSLRIVAFCRDTAVHHLRDIDGIAVVPVALRGGRVARVLTEQVRLPALLRRHRADILFNPAFTGPLWGAPRIVTTVHDLYFRVVPDLLSRGQRMYLSAMVPLCCRRSDCVVTVSKATARDLVGFYPDLDNKVCAIPLASRIPAVERTDNEGSGDTAPFVLMVAALTGNKNPAAVVEAISGLRARHPRLSLVHIGSDPDDRLADAIARHDAGDWVSHRSGVSDAELAAAYRDSLCLVIPSLYEGFGLPVLEAQAMGTPVIASDRGSLPEVGGDGAWYIDPERPETIAAGIDRLIAEPDARTALRQAGYANQKRFSWERTADETLRILLGHRN